MGSAFRRSLPVIVVSRDGEELGWRLTAFAARALVGKAPDKDEVRIQTPGPKPMTLLRCVADVWVANPHNCERYFGEPLPRQSAR
jgi:hypothetical protein